MNLGLEGRRAVVTGGSTGIGFAVARALVREGASVLLGARDSDRLEAARRALEREHEDARVLAHVVDVTDASSLAAFTAHATAELGDPDVLVTNAGGPPAGAFDDVPPERYLDAFDLCFHFVVRLVRSFLPAMRRRGYGRLVHIGSISAREPIESLLLSNVTRSAVLALFKTLARQVASDGVTANVLLPGYTATDRTLELAQGLARARGVGPDEVRRGWEASIPMGRLGRPEEIADVVCFLCSERASYVTGVALPVDGGYLRGLP